MKKPEIIAALRELQARLTRDLSHQRNAAAYCIDGNWPDREKRYRKRIANCKREVAAITAAIDNYGGDK